MAVPRKPVIAVVGAGKCSKKLRDMAVIVGKHIAEQGAVLVCGGLGGIMEGAAQGAKEGNGVTIGILPSDNRLEANEFIDYVIPTGFGEARNIMVVRTADVIIAFPGKYGTLTEMAFALNAEKPVISVNAWKLGEEMYQAETPEEAAKLAMDLAWKVLESQAAAAPPAPVAEEASPARKPAPAARPQRKK